MALAAAGVLYMSIAAPVTSATKPTGADGRLQQLADQMIALQVSYSPASAYPLGAPAPDHRRWPNFSVTAIAALQRSNEMLLVDLRAISPVSLSLRNRFIHAGMVERLEADRQARVCRNELWDVNHMHGWHLRLAEVAREQPVSTDEERVQAPERWSSVPAVVDQQIVNARAGLAAGYSAPKSVVRRVFRQAETLASAEPEALPYWTIANRSDDAAFRSAFRATLTGPVRSGFRRYADFLKVEYVPRAREEIAVTANPNGRACYTASLRSYTTLDRSPEDVFRIGRETVTANAARVGVLGREAFGTGDLKLIAQRIVDAPDNRFSSEEELITFSREVAARAREKSAGLFLATPGQEMRVEPFETYRRGSGGSAYYERQVDEVRPAFFRINSEVWANETRGSAEVTAVHEGYPGDHMQVSSARSVAAGPISNLLHNSAYAEGWARYSEALAEEAGIYRTRYAPMSRRLWPARGMVVDPGIHVMGWTREQAIAFMQESGRLKAAEAEDMVDRIAILPGQLTAYDSGGLEIMALRREAENSLGDRCEIREFHARVLETGSVPLWALRKHIKDWADVELRRR